MRNLLESMQLEVTDSLREEKRQGTHELTHFDSGCPTFSSSGHSVERAIEEELAKAKSTDGRKPPSAPCSGIRCSPVGRWESEERKEESWG